MDVGQISAAETQPLESSVSVRRPQGKQLAYLRGIVTARQGPRGKGKCVLYVKCHSAWTEVDHMDGNWRNDDPDNIRGLCRSCNARERNLLKKESTEVSVSVSVARDGLGEREPPLTDPVKINRVKEPFFLSLLRGSAFLLSGKMECREFHRLMARMTGLSIVTIRDRYVEKYLDDLLVRYAVGGVEYYELTKKGRTGS